MCESTFLPLPSCLFEPLGMRSSQHSGVILPPRGWLGARWEMEQYQAFGVWRNWRGFGMSNRLVTVWVCLYTCSSVEPEITREKRQVSMGAVPSTLPEFGILHAWICLYPETWCSFQLQVCWLQIYAAFYTDLYYSDIKLVLGCPGHVWSPLCCSSQIRWLTRPLAFLELPSSVQSCTHVPTCNEFPGNFEREQRQ